MSPIVPLAFAVLALTACGSGSGSGSAPPPPSPSTTAATAAAPRVRLALVCPPPKESADVCAAVMAYVKNPANGACCAYGSPCTVPIAGQQYGDDKCTTPMGPPPR